MSDKLLDIENLYVEYASGQSTVHALNGINLSVGKGETLGLVGETGAGKTTTALSILRLLPDRTGKVRQGSITYDGLPILKLNETEMHAIRGARISMIFQDPMTSLDPVVTVGEQIEEMIALHSNMHRARIKEAAMEILEVVGIKRERFYDYPHQFADV